MLSILSSYTVSIGSVRMTLSQLPFPSKTVNTESIQFTFTIGSQPCKYCIAFSTTLCKQLIIFKSPHSLPSDVLPASKTPSSPTLPPSPLLLQLTHQFT